METDQLIAVNEFCTCYNIEISFVDSLYQNGLIEITTIEDSQYIDAGQLHDLEKYVRFYYELNINLEGIETIRHLLNRLNAMHDEITILHNRLRIYEDES